MWFKEVYISSLANGKKIEMAPLDSSPVFLNVGEA